MHKGMFLPEVALKRVVLGSSILQNCCHMTTPVSSFRKLSFVPIPGKQKLLSNLPVHLLFGGSVKESEESVKECLKNETARL